MSVAECRRVVRTSVRPDGPLHRMRARGSACGSVTALSPIDHHCARTVGALIRLTPTNQATTSDSTGAFAVAGLPPGQHVVSTIRIGYERRTDTVTIDAGSSVRSQIALMPA
jgi:hypothetical protein